MVRILNLLAIAALIGSAIYAYSIKYSTIFHAEQIAQLNHAIKTQQDAIGMDRAEWAHVTRPERVQALADQLLALQPLPLDQIVQPEAIPDKALKFDAIGRKLDSLGLGEPTNTPRDATATTATPAAR